MKAIEVSGLTKSFRVKHKEKGLKGSFRAMFKPEYKEVKAVKGISFDVDEGEVLAFIGPNGAGKSTTIKMLTGILYPDAGDISVLGYTPSTDRKKLAFKIGTVFGQKEQLWTHLTPYDNFKFFGSIYDVEEKELEERINDLTKTFDLGDIINVPVRNLSLGQRIRCEIVASLIHRPKILFLDEPTIGLDPVVKDNVRKLIKQMNKEYNTTIFLTSHDISDIEKLCKRVIVINNGEIVLDDSMENLKYHYLNKKLVDIKLREGAKVEFGKGVTVVKNKHDSYKLELDLDVSSVSDMLKGLNPDDILDINISNVPLEDTITTIYQKR